MKIVAIIPARLESKRLPRKVLLDIAGKPMIQWVYEAAVNSKLIDEVHVATDSKEVMDAVDGFCGNWIDTFPGHMNGSERVVESARLLNLDMKDWVLNIQADEPLLKPETLDDFIVKVEIDSASLHTLAYTQCKENMGEGDVSVVINGSGEALYFSRLSIPAGDENHLKHIGIYLAQRARWEEYARMGQTPLEKAEKLEQLRFMENGHIVRVYMCSQKIEGVNTVGDINRVREIMRKKENNGRE